MAKVIAPALSGEARGSVGPINFKMTKNGPVAGIKANPTNPQTIEQMEQRLKFGAIAKGVKAIKKTTTISTLETLVKDGEWRSELMKFGLNLFIQTDLTWSALTTLQQDAWNDEAAVAGITTYTLKGQSVSAGFILFLTATAMAEIKFPLGILNYLPDGTNSTLWGALFPA